MSDRTYDQFGHRFVIDLVPAGVAIDGTAAALAAEAGSIVCLPFAAKLVNARMYNVLGATAAVAAVTAHVCRSVGGTGTLFSVGTFAFTGTQATGVSVDVTALATGTAAEFAAGDTICVSEAIGSIGSITTHSFSAAFEELFN